MGQPPPSPRGTCVCVWEGGGRGGTRGVGGGGGGANYKLIIGNKIAMFNIM